VLGLDELIAGWGAGGGLAIAVLVALLLGLRHATDPDHVAAVSTLVLGDGGDGKRGATLLGLAWGAGHAVTLIALGLPFVLWGDALPERAQQAAEIAIGLLIVGLAVRLLVRRRSRPAATPGRTPLAALCIGLLHGVGGSAGAGILLVGTIDDTTAAALALVLFAAATALAMGLATHAFGHVLTRPPVAPRVESAIPALAAAGIGFGAWYALGSVHAVPYVF
jgi:hypothetical protein